MHRVVLSRRAVADLRRVDPGHRLDRLQAGLERLAEGDSNLDIKPLTDNHPWLRLRLGDWRVLFRPAGDLLLVARIVHRRELRQAIRALG